MHLELTAVFRRVPSGYVGYVEELTGANTQSATLYEARANLREDVKLYIESYRSIAGEVRTGPDVFRELL